jgi:hypothetical protein
MIHGYPTTLNMVLFGNSDCTGQAYYTVQNLGPYFSQTLVWYAVPGAAPGFYTIQATGGTVPPQTPYGSYSQYNIGNVNADGVGEATINSGFCQTVVNGFATGYTPVTITPFQGTLPFTVPVSAMSLFPAH